MSSHRYERYAYSPVWEKSPEVHRANNNGPKILPSDNPNTTFTSLLRQPSTIMCCDQFHRNCVSIDNREPPIPTRQSLKIIPWWLTLSKAVLKSICMILACFPLSNELCRVWGYTQQFIAGTQTFPISKLCGLIHTTVFHKYSEQTDIRFSNTLDNSDVMGIGRLLTTDQDDTSFRIVMTLASLQQSGKLPRQPSRQNSKQGWEARTSAILVDISNCQCHHGVKSNKRRAWNISNWKEWW